jgi:hypothetical protein
LRESYYYLLIETDDFVLFRDHGVYSRPIMEYGLNKNIISINDIKYQFKSSNIVPYDFIWDLFDGTDKQKLSINSFVGILGRRKSTFIESSFALSTNTDKIGQVYQSLIILNESFIGSKIKKDAILVKNDCDEEIEINKI